MFEGNRRSLRKSLQRMHPAYLVIFSYLLAAFIGSVLLSIPQASTGERVGPLDALFTATSAICVTGLIVVDTGSQFTVFGKTVILVLIQLGGLGVMTFSVFLFLFLGKRLGTKGRWVINETFTPTPSRDIGTLTRSIFVFTFMVEAVGAAALFLVWRGEMSFPGAIFTSVFHSVSAFCNAGFSFFRFSFEPYRAGFLLNIVIMMLIVIGGIGFPVIFEFFMRFKNRNTGGRQTYSLHTRTVLTTTAFLIFSGALLVYFLESKGSLAGLPFGERVLASFFQSITARTAGFNTLDISSLGAAALFVILMLMFVGASPGSCGGGIKTTSLAVFVGIMKSKVKGMDSVSLSRRTLPEETVSRVLAIFILAVLTISTGLLILLVTQGNPGAGLREHFLTYLFEAVSAFGTVGLSMGITSSLTPAGKIVIIVLMLLGRVGLLTLAYVVTRRERKTSFRYAEEKIMIG